MAMQLKEVSKNEVLSQVCTRKLVYAKPDASKRYLDTVYVFEIFTSISGKKYLKRNTQWFEILAA
jgi:hypothetical protein